MTGGRVICDTCGKGSASGEHEPGCRVLLERPPYVREPDWQALLLERTKELESAENFADLQRTRAKTAEFERDANRSRAEAAEAKLEGFLGPWDCDKPDEYSDRIDDAFPTRSDSHNEYALAMELVGNRNSKGALVALVNWLLLERTTRPVVVSRVRDLLVKIHSTRLEDDEEVCSCGECSQCCAREALAEIQKVVK